MANKEKDYPLNYPKTVVDILEALSMSGGKDMKVVGSASLRSIQWIGDYDAHDSLKGTGAAIAKGFQDVIRRLQKLQDVYTGDIKMGGTMEEPLRWTPQQILSGKNGHTTLEEAVSQEAVRKIDVVGYVSGRYVEVSVVYLYPKEEITEQVMVKELKDGIKGFLAEGDYWKAMKRYFSIQRLINPKRATDMVPIFNGDMGRLYSVISDIKTLLYLLERHKGKKEYILSEVDSFRQRLAGIWRLKEFIKKEPGFDEAIVEAVTHPKKLEAVLTRLLTNFSEVLQREAKYLVRNWGVK